MGVGRTRAIVVVLGIVAALVAATAASAPATGRHYCGHFRARGYTLYTYVTRGHVGCTETRRVLKAWFIDAHDTQHYGRWFCADSHGPALMAGEVEHCSARGVRIADYMHRL